MESIPRGVLAAEHGSLDATVPADELPVLSEPGFETNCWMHQTVCRMKH
jgi:hypothetical protein